MSGTNMTTVTAPHAIAEGDIDWAEKRYLLVDDFVGIRQLLRESLRNLGAKHIDQAASGGEAMVLLSKTRYDVVLCDYNLGEGKNGQQVLEEARMRNLVLPSSVWLMVSAEKSVESVMGAAEHQPDAYIIKPITEGVLLTRLNRVWTRKQVFREIDQAYADKDYLRAAKLCDEQIAHNPLHEVDLLRMKATLLLKSGEPDRRARSMSGAGRARIPVGALPAWPRSAWRMASSKQARQMFQAVMADNRYYIDAYDQLAQSYQHMGKTEEAFEVLERPPSCRPIRCRASARWEDGAQAGEHPGGREGLPQMHRDRRILGDEDRPTPTLAWRACAARRTTPRRRSCLLNAAVQREFGGDQVELRAKITEGLVYHESGDYRRARKAGDELEAMLADAGNAAGHRHLPGHGHAAVCGGRQGSAGRAAVLRDAQQPRQRAAAAERGPEDLRQGPHGRRGHRADQGFAP
jgi:CheY-like chemotaxis protein